MLVGILGATRAHADPRIVTLPELVELARAHSKSVAMANAGVAVRERQKSEALWLWAPMGEATYAITGAPAIQCRGPNNDANPATRTRDCVNTVDPNNGQSITAASTSIHGVAMQGELNLIQPIYTFGKIEALVQLAKNGIDAARAGVDAAVGDAELDATRAFWAAKAARSALEVLSSVREELGPWIERIEKNLERPRPTYTISDLQRLKTALDELDIVRSDLERLRGIARGGMKALVGEEVEVDAEELSPVNGAEHSLDDYQASARLRRPEVRALDAAVAATQTLARLRRNEMLPDVGIDLDVVLRYASSIEDADNAFVWHATTARFGLFLAVRQPIDLFERHARLRTARAGTVFAEAGRDLALTGIDFEVRQGHAELEEARHRLAAAEHGQKTARGWLTAVKQNLDLGTADPRDLADSARRYIELRLRFLQAIADVNIAFARMKRLSGE